MLPVLEVMDKKSRHDPNEDQCGLRPVVINNLVALKFQFQIWALHIKNYQIWKPLKKEQKHASSRESS